MDFAPSGDNLGVSIVDEQRPESGLREPAPGPLWRWVKVTSWVELAIFTALCFFWLAPGFDHGAMIFGWAHGIGFIALCILIWIAVLRRAGVESVELDESLPFLGALLKREQDLLAFAEASLRGRRPRA